MLAFASVAFAQKPFKMQGKIEGEKVNAKYYIQVGQIGNYGIYDAEEEIEVKNSKFNYSKQISEIVPARLKKELGDNDTFMKIYLVPGETLKLTIKGDEYFYDGSPIYKSCNATDLTITPLYKDVMDYYQSAIARLQATPEDKQQEVAKGIQDTLNVKSQAYQDGMRNYLNSHITDEGSVLYLADHIDFNELYNEVKTKSETIANGRVGKYLDGVNEFNEKIRKIQEEQEAAEQAKLDAMNGNPAPDFTLNDIKGNPLTLSSLRGKYVILDFWGSWCGWCIKGIPDMKKYYEKYAGKFEILGVDCNDTEEKWKAAVEKYELPWLHVYNPRTSSVLSDYSVQGFPTKIVIDPQGNIAKIIVGEDPAFYTYLDSLFDK